jgi:hypothetical protein
MHSQSDTRRLLALRCLDVVGAALRSAGPLESMD